MSESHLHFKDAILNRLSREANVAQFISFAPDLTQRYSRVRGHDENLRFDSVEAAVAALLERSGEARVNVRSFLPDDPKAKPFEYDLRTAAEAAAFARKFTAQGLYVIVNETIDIFDGGVSGVAFGDLIELAPGDTPRCVEKPGTASFTRAEGLRLLETVYSFKPELDYDPETRVEFSLHPLRRGYLHRHTIIWELERVGQSEARGDTRWPNRFSRFVGDKAFGLLVADMLGLPVPRTTVIARGLAPFTFGRPTGTHETWLRTCPVEQDPGHFTTRRGWMDPFELLEAEDPSWDLIQADLAGSETREEGQPRTREVKAVLRERPRRLASVLSQAGVDAAYSGSLITQADGTPLVEGARGFGDRFMVGEARREQLPAEVEASVRARYEEARDRLGPVRMEWVHDLNGFTWVVQFHRGATSTQGSVIHGGEASRYHRFGVTRGIDELRALIARVRGTGEGIVLVGHVGVTSHLGDLLRKAEIPSRIEPPSQE